MMKGELFKLNHQSFIIHTLDFPLALLPPSSEFAQEQVCVAAWILDVM
ncbi:MAG: hypothetical protein QOD00_3784 [Blastocatellia bacterium]|jgi:hypothetical protein|nr:hypothetical protein [Blastocatellia bacterium]